MDEVRKAVEMGNGLVDLFEFWEYEVTCYYKDTSSVDLFAEYFNMFLKFKQSPATLSGFRVRKTRTDTSVSTGALRELVWTGHPFPKKGQKLAKLKLNSMWGKWAQNQRNSFYLSERVV